MLCYLICAVCRVLKNKESGFMLIFEKITGKRRNGVSEGYEGWFFNCFLKSNEKTTGLVTYFGCDGGLIGN